MGRHTLRKDGYIYVVSNPAWPGHSKIGRTCRLSDRRKAYQVASPNRDYILQPLAWFEDVHTAERTIHSKLSQIHVNGEWFAIHPHDVYLFVRNLDGAMAGPPKKQVRH